MTDLTSDLTSARALIEHTPGPWTMRRSMLTHDNAYDFAISADGVPVLAEAFGRDADGGWPAAEANARLIAAAPDHALICWAMCVGAGRWEPFGDGRGEFCMNGLRHFTELDEFGCPRVTDAMRRAISSASNTRGER